jgi:hypothetical protein
MDAQLTRGNLNGTERRSLRAASRKTAGFPATKNSDIRSLLV